MSAYAVPTPSITSADRLSVTVFFAVCAHLIVLLGVTFVHEERPRTVTNTLDVVLVQRKSETDPDDADFLGQASQEGGGERDKADRPSTPLPSPILTNTPELAAASPPVVPSIAVQAEETPDPFADAAPAPAPTSPAPVLALEKSLSEDKVVAAQPHEEPTPQAKPMPTPVKTQQVEKTAKAPPAKKRPRKPAKAAPAPQAEAAPVQTINAATLVRRALAMASLSAEVDQRLSSYAKRPHRKWISARTREHKYAAYMDAWRTKVERIGNLNYPDEARRRRLSGELRLDVAIRADGSVEKITVRKPSGHKVLDDAAIRIVQLAAPYPRFPKAIREETDILHIQRTWRFLSSNRFIGG
ncbi:MAG: protein TonB [Gammaproteobacteria bacterium]|jgi:protein TonB